MSRNTGNGRRQAEASDIGPRLPLLPNEEARPPLGRRVDASSLLDDPLLRDLIESRPVQRLRRIGFLGALDRQQARNRHNRYDHSVGVARLAVFYAKKRHLSRRNTRLLAVAGLLHDVGHGPLSHTLEPVFTRLFGICHHKAGSQIIRGESSLGMEIPMALARYGVDPDEVVAMIEGTHHGRHAFLFSSPINLDTIEGITRCRSFFLRRRSVVVSADAIVNALAAKDGMQTQALDSFWLLKHQMYNHYIHHPTGLLYDGLAQAIASQDTEGFTPSDFLKDERQLRRARPLLFTILDRARRAPVTLRSILPSFILAHRIAAPIRKFACNVTVRLESFTDLVARYVQSGTVRRLPIDDLLPTENPTTCPYQLEQEEFSLSASGALIDASRRCANQRLNDSAIPRIS